MIKVFFLVFCLSNLIFEMTAQPNFLAPLCLFFCIRKWKGGRLRNTIGFFSNFLKAVYDLIQKHVTPFFISSRDIVTRLFLGVKIVHVHVHVSHS